MYVMDLVGTVNMLRGEVYRENMTKKQRTIYIIWKAKSISSYCNKSKLCLRRKYL